MLESGCAGATSLPHLSLTHLSASLCAFPGPLGVMGESALVTAPFGLLQLEG